ncbi:uncharacterized protein ISCGN_010627 [Ixodes scapularis]
MAQPQSGPSQAGNAAAQTDEASFLNGAAQAGGVPFFNPFAVETPEKLDFRDLNDWRRWIARWERYRTISGLHLRDQTTQVNTFLYAMGREAEDVLFSLKLSADELNVYDTVKDKFEAHFIPHTNVIFERAKFNMRKQETHETAEAFKTDLHRMADTCDYGSLREDLIRDRLVVGLLHKKLSEKLQLDARLTLQGAIAATRNSETVKRQQHELRGHEAARADVDEVHKRGGRYCPPHREHSKLQTASETSWSCRWCGGTLRHSKAQCPATGKKCNGCKKTGHFQAVCMARERPTDLRPSNNGRQRNSAVDELFVGQVLHSANGQPWTVRARIGQKTLTFKVDTGADVTVIPAMEYDERAMGTLTVANDKLLTAGRAHLPTLGQFISTIQWNNKTTQQKMFVAEGLHCALLGRPAIQALNVLPVLHEVSNSSHCPKEYESLLEDRLGTMKTTYKIALHPDAKPFKITYPRRVPIPILPKVRQEIQRMLDLGVIQQVEHATEWCAPMVVAKKKDDSLRICVHYTELNNQVIRERVIMPTVEENLAKLAGARVFSKLDANAGYWQVPLAPESKELTTFITRVGRFQFQRLPFGISTAPEFFQKEMLRILEGIPRQVCHMDDILVFGTDGQEHDRNLEQVLQCLRNAGVTLNKNKCQFAKNKVKFLGHILDSTGITADSEKTAAVTNMPAPENLKELRSFLGMVNHLAKFLLMMAQKTRPLRDLLHSDASWYWGEPQESAFQQIKAELSMTPVLAYYNPQAQITLSSDASSYGLGSVLLQEDQDGKRLPVAYASRAMTEAEQKYAQVEKEALALTWACEHFRMYLLGLRFHVETDHKPLVPLFSRKRLDEMTPRLERLRIRVLEYDFTIFHTPGKEMHTADVLSRKLHTSQPSHIDEEPYIKEYELFLALELLPASSELLGKLRSELSKDVTTARIMLYCKSQWPVPTDLTPEARKYGSVASELTTVQGLLMRNNRLVIPPVMRQDILERLHSGHQGIVRCRARARDSVWWPGISQQIHDYVNMCPTCQKFRQPGAEPRIQTPHPERPWQEIGMDRFLLDGKNYLVVIDYFSKFFELKQLHRTTSKDVI